MLKPAQLHLEGYYAARQPQHDDEPTHGQGDNEVKLEDDPPHDNILLRHTVTTIRKNVTTIQKDSAECVTTLAIVRQPLLRAFCQRIFRVGIMAALISSSFAVSLIRTAARRTPVRFGEVQPAPSLKFFEIFGRTQPAEKNLFESGIFLQLARFSQCR